MSDTHSPVLVRMRNELKAQLVREAKIYSRSLTAEINTRLTESLKEHSTPSTLKPGADIAEDSKERNVYPTGKPPDSLHATDRAMLEVFRRLPAEKQLALLSLLR